MIKDGIEYKDCPVRTAVIMTDRTVMRTMRTVAVALQAIKTMTVIGD